MSGKGGIALRLGSAAKGIGGEMLGTLLAIPLILLFAFVWIEYGKYLVVLVRAGQLHYIAAGAAVALAVGALFVAVIRRGNPFPPGRFLACSLIGATVAYGAYIASIEVAWISDFETMWLRAVDMAASSDLTVKSIYHERALPVLVPLVMLFGPNPAVVPIANLAMLLVVQLAGYDLARRVLGHRAAQAFVVLWLGAMEPILALPITSHDIWGLFFLVLFFWGFRAARDLVGSGRTGLPHKVAIGVGVLGLAWLLVLLDMQREATPIVLAGAALALLYAWARSDARLRAVALMLVAVFAIYAGIASGLKHAGYMLTAEQGQRLAQIRTGIYGTTLSNGLYRQGQVLWKQFFFALPPPERQDLAHAVPLSDFALQPQSRFGNLVERSRKQAWLGSQHGFYQAQAKPATRWLIPFTRVYNVCYSLLIAALGLLSVVAVLRRPVAYEGLALFALLSVLVGALVLTGESQPRYVFPLWFIMAQVIAYAAVGFETGDMRAGIAKWWIPARSLILLLLAFLVLALAARWLYAEKYGRVLSGWRHTLVGAAKSPPEGWFEANQLRSAGKIRQMSKDPRVGFFGELVLVLKLPVSVGADGGIEAEKRVCAGADRRALDLYYYVPNKDPIPSGSFRLEIRINDRLLDTIRWPADRKIRHLRIPEILPAGECGQLRLNLRANEGPSRVSKINASQIDLYFMRLVR